MSTTDAPRKSIVLPSGRVRTGRVVEEEWVATAREKYTRTTVEIGGHLFVVDD